MKTIQRLAKPDARTKSTIEEDVYREHADSSDEEG